VLALLPGIGCAVPVEPGTGAPALAETRQSPTASAATPPAATPLTQDEAGAQRARLEALEARLLNEDYETRFVIRSEGAIESELHGHLRFAGDEIEVEARGEFAGESVSLRLHADAETLRISNRDRAVEATRPPHLREAIALGFTRMGLLHNLAMLTGAQPPDRADGGMQEWVRLGDFGRAPVHERPQTSSATGTISASSFEIVVAGQPAGHATLWSDHPLAIPLERTQVVQFPEGEMRVHELYLPKGG
jgi:hypothetical protein